MQIRMVSTVCGKTAESRYSFPSPTQFVAAAYRALLATK